MLPQEGRSLAAALDHPQPPTADLDLICAAYGLGQARDVGYLPAGTMNRNWCLTTDGGRFALKELLDAGPDDIRRAAPVTAALAAQGVPACTPRLTRDADAVLTIGDRAYCLLPWIEGEHPRGTELTAEQCLTFGAFVGRLHAALADPRTGLPAPPTMTPSEATGDPRATYAAAVRFRTRAAAEGTVFDLAVDAALADRLTLLREHTHRRPRDVAARGRFGWTHGDLQHRNLLWRDGEIVAVLDWDRLRPRPVAQEVVRTLTVQFTTPAGELDLPRCAAFVSGYRSAVPLSSADLADALQRQSWDELTSLWHLKFRYDRDIRTCDELFLPHEQLLHWWTHNEDLVTTALTGGWLSAPAVPGS